VVPAERGSTEVGVPATAGCNAPGAAVPAGLPGIAEVMARAGGENFPVALRVLRSVDRRRLLAIYGFARLVDEVGDGDLAPADRAQALAWLEVEVERALEGRASHPLVAAAGAVVAELGLSAQPLRDLVAANQLDQLRHSYRTFDQVLGSCELSANPVGRLVLGIFGVTSPEATAWSDDVCTGLQLAEHLQDVGEDARRGRIYLAEEDRRAYGCEDADLVAATASPALRQLVAAYCSRARALLLSAVPLARCLPWQPRLAVAGFAAGGLAALDAIEAARFDVLGMACRPRPATVVRRALAVLVGRSPADLRLLARRPAPVVAR
jgi:squalene synthase HpnC